MKILTSWLRTYVFPRLLSTTINLLKPHPAGHRLEGVHSLGDRQWAISSRWISPPTASTRMNHYGIAREAATIYNLPLAAARHRLPLPARGHAFPVAYEAPELCGRFNRARAAQRHQSRPAAGAAVAGFFDLLGQKQSERVECPANFTLLGMAIPRTPSISDQIEGRQSSCAWHAMGETHQAARRSRARAEPTTWSSPMSQDRSRWPGVRAAGTR